MVRKNQIKLNLAYSVLYQLLLIMLPLITTPYISRVLGAEKIGIYSYNNTIASYFVMFACLGITNYGNRSIAQVKDNSYSLNRTFSSLYSFQLLTSLSITVVYALYIVLLASDKRAAFLEGIYVISAVIDLNWVLNGLEEFKYITIRSSLVKILSAVLIFCFISASDDIYLYITICCGSFLASNLFAIPVLLKHKIRFVSCKFSEIVCHWKPMLILFIPLVGMSVYKYMNKILLTYFSTLEETGFLESSERVLLVPICFVTALGNVMLPRMSSLYAQNNEAGANKYLENSFYFAMIASSSMGFGIIAVIKEFVPLFYGKGFEKCETIIPILMISPVFLAVANVIRTQFLIPKGKDKEYVISILFGAVVDIFTALFFIPKYAAIGAAIATTCTELAVCFMQIFLSRKESYMLKYILKSLPFMLFGIIMCFVVYNISFNFSIVLNLILKIIIGTGMIALMDGSYLYLLNKR